MYLKVRLNNVEFPQINRQDNDILISLYGFYFNLFKQSWDIIKYDLVRLLIAFIVVEGGLRDIMLLLLF